MGHIECGDLSASKLKKNMLDIALMKKQLKDYLTGRWLDSRQFDSDHKAAARKIFASASSYREKFVVTCLFLLFCFGFYCWCFVVF